MKVIHLADLHLGKLFHKVNIIKDQEYILTQILAILKEQKASLIIAGDVFDSANPSLEAQELFLKFMKEIKVLCKENDSHCWIIVGNHDSNRRLLLWADFLCPEIEIIDGQKTIDCADVRFSFLSFVKPVFAQLHFNRYFDSYRQAFKAYLEQIADPKKTILIAHQSFEGCTTGSSETMSFFDDAIPLDDVKEFPLVLAGHIHKKQTLQNVFYPGSLLPYAFGDKFPGSVRVWDLNLTKEDYEISFIDEPVSCLHELQIIKGDLKRCLAEVDTGAFVKVELIEDIDLDLAISQLRAHFKNLITVTTGTKDTWEADLNKPSEQFKTFDEAIDAFCKQVEIPLFTEEQMQLIREVLHEITNTAH